jgi:hypothetical protein
MRVHPIHVIITGLLICSIGFNILQWNSNNRLVYQIQKLEAGPARGLFIQPDEKPKPQLKDEELNELLKEMLRKMMRERIT